MKTIFTSALCVRFAALALLASLSFGLTACNDEADITPANVKKPQQSSFHAI